MIINLASGRGPSRVISQKNNLLKRARSLKDGIFRREHARRKKRESHCEENAIRAKWGKCTARYNLLMGNVQKLAYDVMETGDAYSGERKCEVSGEGKGEVLRLLKEVEQNCCVELEGRRLDVIINGIKISCPEKLVSGSGKRNIGMYELEVAIELLQRAEEFLQLLMDREEKLIPTYEMIEQYGGVVGEVVQLYDALDLLEEIGQRSVQIHVSGREHPVDKEAIFRLFRMRMVGEIEELKNGDGEIYEMRIHTVTVGEWEDMVAAAAEGIGKKVSAPEDEEIKAAFKEAVLVRDAFKLAARALYEQMGGKEKVAEALNEGGGVIEVDFGKRT
ncbi:MAG: hypothetical protein GY852_02235 [bacterium]|nr:hypothetical protein [bacterium]